MPLINRAFRLLSSTTMLPTLGHIEIFRDCRGLFAYLPSKPILPGSGMPNRLSAQKKDAAAAL